MKHSIVYIRYTDTVTYDVGEYMPDAEYKLVVFDAVGFLIRETEDAVYICREINTTHDMKHRSILGIPKMNIIKRQDFTVGE